MMDQPKVSVSFDEEAKAAYVRFSMAHVAETIEATAGLLVDLDHHGRLVGVEILAAGALQVFRERKLPKDLPPMPETPRWTIRQLEEFFGVSAA